ncbi:(dimethylallyl)adenosine tRNA methylthiotransferase, partial [Ehrlichia ruminantium]
MVKFLVSCIFLILPNSEYNFSAAFSLIIENIIKPLGFSIVNEPSEADIVILNTCHIREKAAEKLYSELGRIRKIQETKNLTIVVAGCVAQAEGTEIFTRAPFVDIVVG